MPPRSESPFIPTGGLREEPSPRRAPAGVPSPLRGRPHHQQQQQQRGGNSHHSGATQYRQQYGHPPDPGYQGAHSNPWGYAVPPNAYPPYPPQAGYPPHGAYPPAPNPYPPHGAYPPVPGGPYLPSHGHGGFPPAPGYPPPYGPGPPHPNSGAVPSIPMGPTPFGYPYHFTMGMGPGPLPYGQPPEPAPVERPLDAGDCLVDKWASGPNYGPVLTPLEVSILDVKVHINPLLESSPDSSDKPYLEYNVLLPVRTAHRSTDPHGRSWTSGRTAPATFPRVTKLNLISRKFNWVITVEAENPALGVTCVDVLHGIHDDMNRLAPRAQVESLPARDYNLLIASYHINRSTARHAPGGEFGQPMKRGDFLHRHVMFDGIVEDEAFTLRKLVASGPGWKGLKKDNRRRGYPVTFVLNLDEYTVHRIQGRHGIDDGASTTTTDGGRDDTTETGETTGTELGRDT